MKIFGHPWIESEIFYSVNSVESIKSTPPNALLRLEKLSSSLYLVKYCQKNSLFYSVEVQSIKEAIFANLLGAKFILCSKKLAVELMPIAQNYLFDTQVLAYIFDENEMEELAKQGVDGVFIT
jgi:hypothetical protein